MSIASQITRLQNAKSSLKLKLEKYIGVSIPSSDVLDNYPNYFPDMYSTPPASNGVYIRYTDGTYSDYNYLVSGKTPVGVALRTDNGAWTLHPLLLTGRIASPGYETYLGTGINHNYLNNPSYYSYDGAVGLQTLINSGRAGTVVSVINSNPFADGTTGWIPSNGEYYQILLNQSAVNIALSLIGGNTLGSLLVNIANRTSRNSNNYQVYHTGSKFDYGNTIGSDYGFRVITNFS